MMSLLNILQSGARTGVPLPPGQRTTWTEYAAGGTPLAVTQKDFLVDV